MTLAGILSVLYMAGYFGFAMLGGYGVIKGKIRLTWIGLSGWVLWSGAWFAAAALIH